MLYTILFIGTTEIVVIGGIALLIFGGKKLPELMRGLGKGIKEFKEGMHEVKEEITGENNSETAKQSDDCPDGTTPSKDE